MMAFAARSKVLHPWNLVFGKYTLITWHPISLKGMAMWVLSKEFKMMLAEGLGGLGRP